jgi:hypothetical protein
MALGHIHTKLEEKCMQLSNNSYEWFYWICECGYFCVPPSRDATNLLWLPPVSEEQLKFLLHCNREGVPFLW